MFEAEEDSDYDIMEKVETFVLGELERGLEEAMKAEGIDLSK